MPVPFDWGYFPCKTPCFLADLTKALCEQAGLPGILGDCHASGTEIISELGERHMRTGMPVCYTSADSVFQIAAHEQTFGLERLYDICSIARRLVDPLNIGRVIARPFDGAGASDFRRTAHRRDFSVPPPGSTTLDLAASGGRDIVTIGKIDDIFAHRATGRNMRGDGNMALLDCTLTGLASLADGGLLFANFIDFDTLYGHRRDVAGYAGRSRPSTVVFPTYCLAYEATIFCSSPPTMAAIRPGAARITRASRCPSWPGVRNHLLPSAAATALPTSARPRQGIWACLFPLHGAHF